MSGPRSQDHSYIAWLRPGLLILLSFVLHGAGARGDVIELRGGGEIQGKVVNHPTSPTSVQVFLMKGSKPLTFQKAQILNVTPKPSPLDDYVVKREQLSATAQSEFGLGEWCESQKLTDLSRYHYQRAILLEPSFEAAHKKLGHVLVQGNWLSSEDVRRGQGLVKYHGQWITAAERDKREQSSMVMASQAGWLRRIRLLRQAILTAPDDRRREAEAELMQIQESEAVIPLVKALGKDPIPIRLLLVQTLAQIKGKESSRALVQLLLADSENQVRSAIIERLRERDEPEIIRQMEQALRNKDLRMLNRAAWGLGQLNSVMSVPRLVGVLQSSEERLTIVPNEPIAAASGPGVLPGPVLMGMNQSFAAYMTGPSVAPGTVAYGAASVPWIGTGFPVTGGYMGMGAAPNREPQLRFLTFTYQNVEVLAALQKLTGQDFGYDDNAWRQWIKTSYNPNPAPVRQVHQP